MGTPNLTSSAGNVGITTIENIPAYVLDKNNKYLEYTSVAACYALFESRTSDSEIGSTTQMPPEILNYVNNAFATNGYLGFAGWKNSNGVTPDTYLNQIGDAIKGGADVASTVASKRNEVTRCIADTLARAK